MPRILIVDTYYPDFLKSLTFDSSSTYEAELRKVLDRCFGTFDAYSRALKALGWDAIDVIANHLLMEDGHVEGLQRMWAREHRMANTRHPWAVLEAQAADFEPNVIFMQDLSLDPPTYGPRILAGQCSCPWPGDEQVRQYDVVFSSFPHYIPRIQALGVKAIYNPLAFDVSVLARLAQPEEREIDVCFIGGVGNPSHWRHGMEVLNAVAEAVPSFRWWGYGVETLPDGPLKQKYQGEAWGLDMYEILLQSRICLNRHGEVAEGYANNMRMFEATGCGAMLLTERAPNLEDFFAWDEVETYADPEEAVDTIEHYLGQAGSPVRAMVAERGQKRTLRDHTYKQRMQVVSETLLGIMGHKG